MPELAHQTNEFCCKNHVKNPGQSLINKNAQWLVLFRVPLSNVMVQYSISKAIPILVSVSLIQP